ncbi:hypothetical protein C6P40_004044 [Pichia californica]|uniref:Uncharacterized protein n=1 Tax=Pichia californica TaxID=460514 RepID=A0A9P7BG14_9ASCO|nr:hypothetical protein C6P42_002196 [[Candida] californica]KAG0691232.1 hypothetical protein C6P40_004044 [[Candida] californica]
MSAFGSDGLTVCPLLDEEDSTYSVISHITSLIPTLLIKVSQDMKINEQFHFNRYSKINLNDYLNTISEIIKANSDNELLSLLSKLILVDNNTIDLLDEDGFKGIYMKHRCNGDQYVIENPEYRKRILRCVYYFLDLVLAEAKFDVVKTIFKSSRYDDLPIVKDVFKTLGYPEGMKFKFTPLPIQVFLIRKISAQGLTHNIY